MTAPLADLQARLHGYVVDDGPAPGDLVRKPGRGDLHVRLAVYRDGYRLRLLEALGEDYPALKSLLGDDGFEALGRAYIARARSRHYSIRWFGKALADFLAADENWLHRPGTAELARWEWSLGEAMDAADATAVEAAAIAAVPPERWAGIRLAFQPSLRRLDLAWSVPQFRLAVEEKQPSPPVPEELPAAVAWVIWRDRTKVLYRSLADDEASALDAGRGGAPFGRLCEMLAEARGANGAAATAAGFLKSWVDAGWIAGINT